MLTEAAGAWSRSASAVGSLLLPRGLLCPTHPPAGLPGSSVLPLYSPLLARREAKSLSEWIQWHRGVPGGGEW